MRRDGEPKLKLMNYISAVCFLLSSASLLFIPMLDFKDGFPAFAYFLAGAFWLGLLAGSALQIYMGIRTRKAKISRPLKTCKLAAVGAFAASIVSATLILLLLRNNTMALPINLFITLLSAEAFCVIKRMERIAS